MSARYMNENGSMVTRDNGCWMLVTAHAAEVERLTAERDALRRAMAWWRDRYRSMCAEATETATTLNRNFVNERRRAETAESERDAAVARAEKAEADAFHFCAGLCVHPDGVIGDEGGSNCCPITGTRDAIAVQAAPIDRERRLEFALRRCQQLADDGVDDPAGPYNVLAHISNAAEAALAAASAKPHYAALAPESWGGTEGEE